MSIPTVECVGIADNYGRFRISPLETGYGLTLGNALRRILLSSLEGAAVTSVQIEGVYHEFSSLEGIKEDITDIILNIKKLRVRSYSDRPVTLRLDVSGPRQVTAADIRPHAEVDIVSADQPVATLDNETAHLQMELIVQKGRGYVPAEAQEDLPIGMIALDAIYSPITKVNYVVERTRVGQKTDYDQLIMEIWTDGSVAPGDALSQAARILVEQSEVIAAYAQGDGEIAQGPAASALLTAEADGRSIDELGLTARTLNCLKRAHLTTVGQVLGKNRRDLLGIRNFGDKSLDELQEKLQDFGYLPADMPEGYLASADENAPIGTLGQQVAGDAPVASFVATPDDEDAPAGFDADLDEEYAE